jgi:hypothetical protein
MRVGVGGSVGDAMRIQHSVKTEKQLRNKSAVLPVLVCVLPDYLKQVNEFHLESIQTFIDCATDVFPWTAANMSRNRQL